MSDDAVVERLDRLTAILQLAHKDALDRARASIRSDKVSAAILDGAKSWTPAGKLKQSVTKKTSTGSTTFKDRVTELLATGALEKQGGGPTTHYRATGLI